MVRSNLPIVPPGSGHPGARNVPHRPRGKPPDRWSPEMIPRTSRYAPAMPCLAGLAATLLLAAGLAAAPDVMTRPRSPEGTLVAESDDPAVKVRVDGDDVVATGSGAG